MLACHVLSCDQTYLFFHQNEELDDKVLLASAALINERTAGRPIQYVMGKANFYGIDLAVDERVLIPRPETEILVENVLKSADKEAKFEILDLCTGSGCIAAAVAENLPNAHVTASDLSPKAFMLARYNIRPYANADIVRGDLFEPVAGRKFDYILSNPPYIPTKAIEKLQKEVKDYEPMMALDGGSNGLDIVIRILEQAPEFLNEGGSLYMEIGHDQSLQVLEFARKSLKFKDFGIIKDLEGHDRIFYAKKAQALFNKKAGAKVKKALQLQGWCGKIVKRFIKKE